MLTQRRFPLWRGILGNWRLLVLLAIYSSLICSAHLFWNARWLVLPALPISLLGTAVAFYLGFKGNSAYDRLWEARKIWGGIVNTSRTWGIHITGMVTAPTDMEPKQLHQLHQSLVYRHIAWLGALRTQLRRPKPWEHLRPGNDSARRTRKTFDQSPQRLRDRIAPFMSVSEVETVMAGKNQATHILKLQSEALQQLLQQNCIDDFRHMELAKLLETMFTLQGRCERIKNFPLPRQYATANHWFIMLFITMVPMALVGVFENSDSHQIWWSVPLSMMLGWVFMFWDQLVDFSENPFEGLFMDVPIDSLSRTIEIDLREMLDETTLPEPHPLCYDGAMM